MVNEQIKALLQNPDDLLRKRPFTRGGIVDSSIESSVQYNGKAKVQLPALSYNVIDQSEYFRELDPACHKCLFDDNIPSITTRTKDGGYIEVEHKKLSIPFQRNIKNKQVLHLCGNPMDFTLMDTEPSERQQENFITFKQYWNLRNQDGMKTQMVDKQKSYGDAGLLYYMDYKGRVKSRILSYPDYILIPHNDDNGDRILESIYYQNTDGEFIDSYDDTYMYRIKRTSDPDSKDKDWVHEEPKKHGFSEIPLITKRGKVAWDSVQTLIEVYEILYNVFIVIQKRHGWGLLYIKGKFNETAKKIAGSVILNDASMDNSGDARYLTPPTPQGTIDTLQLLEENIQKGSGTTFILPKDVKISGQISGIAIMLTQSMDIETALQGVIDWQNVADKMTRLFKEGLAMELVLNGSNRKAVTEFEELSINAKFKVWRPQSDVEFSQMLVTLKGSGLLSEESGVELNPVSRPDEKARLKKEKEAAESKSLLDTVVQTASKQPMESTEIQNTGDQVNE